MGNYFMLVGINIIATGLLIFALLSLLVAKTTGRKFDYIIAEILVIASGLLYYLGFILFNP